MDIVASGLCFLLTCIVGLWAIHSRRKAINTRHELDEIRRLKRMAQGLDDREEE